MAQTTGAPTSPASSSGMVYKGVGPRFLALVIDAIILGVLMGIFFMLFGKSYPAGCASSFSIGATDFNDESFYGLCGFSSQLYMLVGILYYLLLEWLAGGTVGKMALGMKIVKVNGEKMDFVASLLRNLLRIVDGLFFYLVGAILIWKSDKKQRLGDRVAKTVVVAKSSVK